MEAMHIVPERTSAIHRKIHALRNMIPNPHNGDGTSLRLNYLPGFEEYSLLTTDIPFDLATINQIVLCKRKRLDFCKFAKCLFLRRFVSIIARPR
jgi:hypothetical protein